MPNTLQAASAQADRLLDPSNLLQVAILAAAVLAGWWIGRRLRPSITPSDSADDLAGRAREALWIAAPYACVLMLFLAAAGLLRVLGGASAIVDAAVQLATLLLVIRVLVYV